MKYLGVNWRKEISGYFEVEVTDEEYKNLKNENNSEECLDRIWAEILARGINAHDYEYNYEVVDEEEQETIVDWDDWED